MVLAYFVTESKKLYVFDDHTLLVIKKPPRMEEIEKHGFWTWFYEHYAIKTFQTVRACGSPCHSVAGVVTGGAQCTPSHDCDRTRHVHLNTFLHPDSVQVLDEAETHSK